MQVCISYLFIFVPVINEEYYEKDKNIIALCMFGYAGNRLS
jgi:hypothetical protein